jgi:hypothetical protein
MRDERSPRTSDPHQTTREGGYLTQVGIHGTKPDVCGPSREQSTFGLDAGYLEAVKRKIVLTDHKYVPRRQTPRKMYRRESSR